MEKKISHGCVPAIPAPGRGLRRIKNSKPASLHSGLNETIPQSNVEKIGYLVKRGRPACLNKPWITSLLGL